MKVQIKRLDSVTHNDTTATKLINDNFKVIQDEIELHLSRDGKEPNFMNADLDMNAHRIINSVYPTEDVDVATKKYVDDVAGNAAEYAAQASASAARAAVSEQQSEIYAQVAEEARTLVEEVVNTEGFQAVAEDIQSEDSSIKKTANNIEDIHKAALLDAETVEKAGEVGEHIDEILPITEHLDDIDAVSANITSVTKVSDNINNVNKVALVDDNIVTVATNINSVNTVSANIVNVNRVAPNAQKIADANDNFEQLLKQINGEGGLDSIVSGNNVTQATSSVRGTARFATDSEAQAGTSTNVMITPKQLKQYSGGGSVDTYTKAQIDSMFDSVGDSIEELEETKANVSDLIDLSGHVDAIEEDKANVDADNFSDDGKSIITSYSFPSLTKRTDLTLGASESTYTAPADGWFVINKAATAAGQRLGIYGRVSLNIYSSAASQPLCLCVPCKKGGTVTIRYTASGNVSEFRFVYAGGEE